MEKMSQSKYNWPLIGNKKNIDFLSRSLANNKLANSYIFSGPDNMGKTKLAEHLAKIILCEKKGNLYTEKPCGNCSSCKKFGSLNLEENLAHNDFYVIKKEKDKKNISVEQIRELIHSLGMSSFSNAYKVGIIKHADKLTEQASNALLKLLEEPKKKVLIVLVSSSVEKMLPTIISRCQILDFRSVKTDEINKFLLDNCNVTRSAAKNYSRISLGRPALALKFIEDKEFYNNYINRLELFLDIIESNDINEKFSLAASLIDKKLSGLEASAILKRLLETLQGIYRDMYLISYGLNNLVQNEIVDDRLKKNQVKNSIEKITKLLDEIDKADEYIGANLGSKLILENITLSL